MELSTSPCEWPLAEPSEACSAKTLASLNDEDKAMLESMAVELLWAWTGRKYGLCEVTLRPCRAECSERFSTFYGGRGTLSAGGGWLPVIFGGKWYNIGCGACGHLSCSCEPDRRTALMLPGPISEIESIWEDGELLPPESYRLSDDVLYWLDGKAWPMCNDPLADPREAGSGAWEITAKRGLPVPVGGQLAALRLAEELAKALCNDSSCELPSRVQSITRQGVSMEMVSTEFAEMREGKTGIWIIDSWVASTQAPIDARPSVMSPDVRPGKGRDTYGGLGRARTR